MKFEYDRITCPTCGAFMIFQSQKNPVIKTLLICFNTDCDTVLESEHDVYWWQKQLRRDDDKSESGRPDSGVETVEQEGVDAVRTSGDMPSV